MQKKSWLFLLVIDNFSNNWRIKYPSCNSLEILRNLNKKFNNGVWLTMRKETSQKAFVYHSIPSSRKFDVANKQKIKKNYSKEELGTFVGYQNEFV